MRRVFAYAAAIALGASCGGKGHAPSHAAGHIHGGEQNAGAAGQGLNAGVGAEADAGALAMPPAVVFSLHNRAREELVFSLDRGWQPVIFAYSGKPPHAKSILMFPSHCTAPCAAAASDRCPFCPPPETSQKERESELRRVVAAGDTVEVFWDGQVHVYQDTVGFRDGQEVTCQCYRKEPVAPNSYTVKACGLRVTKTALERSKYQCVEAAMTVPSDEPQIVEFLFGQVRAPKKKKKGRR